MTVTSQPYAIVAPSITYCESNEKGCTHQHNGAPAVARRCRCERAVSRRIVTALLLTVFSFALFLLVSFLWDAAFNEASWLSSLGLVDGGSGSAWSAVSGFVKRQVVDNGNGQNTFVHRKCTWHMLSYAMSCSWNSHRLPDRRIRRPLPRRLGRNMSQCLVLPRYVAYADALALSPNNLPCVGAFENPLCCPCYLCACCGGLGTSRIPTIASHD